MKEDFTDEEKRGFYKAIYSRRDVRSHFISKPIEDEKVVLFYSDKYTRRDTIKLINATGENLVVTRMEDIHNYIRLQMNPEYFDETK